MRLHARQTSSTKETKRKSKYLQPSEKERKRALRAVRDQLKTTSAIEGKPGQRATAENLRSYAEGEKTPSRLPRYPRSAADIFLNGLSMRLKFLVRACKSIDNPVDARKVANAYRSLSD